MKKAEWRRAENKTAVMDVQFRGLGWVVDETVSAFSPLGYSKSSIYSAHIAAAIVMIGRYYGTSRPVEELIMGPGRHGRVVR